MAELFSPEAVILLLIAAALLGFADGDHLFGVITVFGLVGLMTAVVLMF